MCTGGNRIQPHILWGAVPTGAPGSAPPFPCRVTIPLYDADTGLLVLAGKVRCHGWGVYGGTGGTGGCRGVW